MMFLPTGLRRVSQPNDERIVVSRNNLRGFLSKLVVSIRS